MGWYVAWQGGGIGAGEAQELEFPSTGPRAPNAMATLQAPAPAKTRMARLGGTARPPDRKNAA